MHSFFILLFLPFDFVLNLNDFKISKFCMYPRHSGSRLILIVWIHRLKTIQYILESCSPSFLCEHNTIACNLHEFATYQELVNSLSLIQLSLWINTSTYTTQCRIIPLWATVLTFLYYIINFFLKLLIYFISNLQNNKL
jgi:hypothetical protein